MAKADHDRLPPIAEAACRAAAIDAVGLSKSSLFAMTEATSLKAGDAIMARLVAMMVEWAGDV